MDRCLLAASTMFFARRRIHNRVLLLALALGCIASAQNAVAASPIAAHEAHGAECDAERRCIRTGVDGMDSSVIVVGSDFANVPFSGSAALVGSSMAQRLATTGAALGLDHPMLTLIRVRPLAWIAWSHVSFSGEIGIGSTARRGGLTALGGFALEPSVTVLQVGTVVGYLVSRGAFEARASLATGVRATYVPIDGAQQPSFCRGHDLFCAPSLVATQLLISPELSGGLNLRLNDAWRVAFGASAGVDLTPAIEWTVGAYLRLHANL